jgi:hypothetical protein
MASPNIYTSGIGGTVGAELALQKPLFTSGNIYYVSSVTGASGNTGKERNRPYDSFANLIASLAAGDIVVLLSGHTETLASSALTLAGVTIVGEGSGTNAPYLYHTITDTTYALSASGAGVHFYNINFAKTSSTTGSAVPILQISGAGCVVGDGCTFTLGEGSRSIGLELVTGATNTRIQGATFTSAATTISSVGPSSAIKVTNAVTDLTLIDLTIDGGLYGWSNPYAISVAGAVTRLFARGTTLIGDSDVSIVTGSTGLYTSSGTGGSNRVVWAA